MYKKVVRLYRQNDLDLITLLHSDEVSLPLLTTSVLKMYATGKRVVVKMPPMDCLPKEDEIHNKYTYTLYFDEKEDAKTLALIKKVREGYQNGFIKNVVRAYLLGGYCGFYFDDPRDSENYFDLMERGTSIVPYERISEFKPHKIPDKLLENKGIVFHTEDDEVIDDSEIPPAETAYKPRKEEKESQNTEKVKETAKKEKITETKEEISVDSEIILLGEDESDFSENITQKHADLEPELTKNEEEEIFNLFESL